MVSLSKSELNFFNRFMTQMNKLNNNLQNPKTLIEKLAKDMPDSDGIYYKDHSWTWKAVNDECNKYANFFLNKGFKKNQSIGIMMKNCPEYLFLTTGINKIEGVSGLINYNQKRSALLHSINIIEPKFLVIDGDNVKSVSEIADDLTLKNDQIFVIRNYDEVSHDFVELPLKIKNIKSSNPSITTKIKSNDPLYYIFTSGTTGLPKAIVMPLKKSVTQATFLATALCELNPNDVIYNMTPFYHNIAIGINWMASLLSGAINVVKEGFSASSFWEDVIKYSVTYTSYVGEIPRYLLNQPSSKFEKEAKLEYMVGLGLRESVWKEFKRRFNVNHIYEYYGSTEGHRCFINIDGKPGMVGRNNFPGIVLAKVNPETGEFYKNEKGYCVKCKNPGEVGMVLIKLDKGNFFAKYKDKKKTEKKLIKGAFRKGDLYFNSGDILMLHEDGWLSFYDRTGDTFRWKGENVSTLELESILNSHPAVSQSTVFGISIPHTEGKAGMASIILNPIIDFNIKEFSKYVYDVLPSYSIPIFIRICEEFEHTGTFKIKKKTLEKQSYDHEQIKDPLYFWDNSHKLYIPYNKKISEKLLSGKLKI
ncbi:MAG: long-chain-acyl-CoA synthetase [Candidatus Lokiarchaeota archaeon]|nr:long-chain-acyl-CoA synthetase [Candidatus Lokiarchaeota archaeon]